LLAPFGDVRGMGGAEVCQLSLHDGFFQTILEDEENRRGERDEGNRDREDVLECLSPCGIPQRTIL
jgi:hypothetical protein